MRREEHIEKILKSARNKVVTINLEKAAVFYTDKNW